MTDICKCFGSYHKGVDDEVRTQFVTTIFSTGLTFSCPLRAGVLSTIASSPVTITESEIVTLLVQQMSIPSAFTPFSDRVNINTSYENTVAVIQTDIQRGEWITDISLKRISVQLLRMNIYVCIPVL